jgi:UPF0042 nucleotide-binding protein
VSEFLIIAGLSGAGRSTAADTFEDLGWFVIDNLPPALIGKVAELVGRPGAETEKVALVVGRSVGGTVEELTSSLELLRKGGDRVRIVFLEASPEVLVRRFEGTRRRHPMEGDGMVDSISLERDLLQPIRDMADVVVDTTELNVHQLRDRLLDLFSRDDSAAAMRTSIVSFGYKYGAPLDADLVLDCRFLPNPHWVDELRNLTGLDEPVRDYVLGQPITLDFLARLDHLLALVLPGYVEEGKSYLTIAVGCTGGQHRSVVLAEEIARCVEARGFTPTVHHRDVDR